MIFASLRTIGAVLLLVATICIILALQLRQDATEQPFTVINASNPTMLSMDLLRDTTDGRTLFGFEMDTEKRMMNMLPLPKVIALTFDDGPHPINTVNVLDILKEHDVRATFFVLGSLAQQYPEILQRMNANGHEIGNHTFYHTYKHRMSEAAIGAEIEKTNEVVKNATGIRPHLLRTPYGEMTNHIKKVSPFPIIFWSVDSLDWKLHNAEKVTQRIKELIHPGAVILMHDHHKYSAESLPAIIAELRAQGYRFVTVSELYGFDKTPERAISGELYYYSTLEPFR